MWFDVLLNNEITISMISIVIVFIYCLRLCCKKNIFCNSSNELNYDKEEYNGKIIFFHNIKKDEKESE